MDFNYESYENTVGPSVKMVSTKDKLGNPIPLFREAYKEMRDLRKKHNNPREFTNFFGGNAIDFFYDNDGEVKPKYKGLVGTYLDPESETELVGIALNSESTEIKKNGLSMTNEDGYREVYIVVKPEIR